MPFRIPLLIFTAVLLTGQGLAAPLEMPGELRQAGIEIVPFDGSLGATAQQKVQEELLASGDCFLQDPGPRAYKIGATASGGKINGTLSNPAGKVLFSETYDQQSLHLNVLQFCEEIHGAIFSRAGIGLTQIAFVSDATGNKEIFMCDADGSNLRQVTRDHATCASPSLRNDALLLAFTSYVSGYPDIYMIDLRTNARRRIVNAPGTNSGAAFSPDGQRLAMTMSFSGSPELYVTNPGGLGGQRLTSTNWAEASPAWSPDGKQLVFSANPTGKPQLFIMASTGGVPTPLSTGYSHATEPNWSPDGQHIAATVKIKGRKSIVITNLTTSRTHLLAEGEDPCWGVDGRHLVFVQDGRLIVHHVLQGTSRTVVSNLGHLTQPSWSR